MRKSLTLFAACSRKYLSSQSFLRVNQTVLSHRGQNLVDDGASLGVNSRSADAEAMAATRPPTTCCPPITTFDAPQTADLPCAAAVGGTCAGRSNIRDYTFEWRDEPPPSASERYKTLCMLGPSTRRGTPHDIACANSRRSLVASSRGASSTAAATSDIEGSAGPHCERTLFAPVRGSGTGFRALGCCSSRDAPREE